MPLRQTKLWGSLASHVDHVTNFWKFQSGFGSWTRLLPGGRDYSQGRGSGKSSKHLGIRFQDFGGQGMARQRFPRAILCSNAERLRREDMFFGCFAMLLKLGQRIHLIWIYQGMFAVSTATGPEASGKEDEGSSRSSAEGLFPDLAETKGEGSENLAFSCEWKI